MLWMLWLLVIPVIAGCLLLLGLGRAAARPCPKPSPLSTREPERREDLSKESPVVRRRLEAGPLYRGLASQTGHVRFLAGTRKGRSRPNGAG
jgi:hypothetical protein